MSNKFNSPKFTESQVSMVQRINELEMKLENVIERLKQVEKYIEEVEHISYQDSDTEELEPDFPQNSKKHCSYFS